MLCGERQDGWAHRPSAVSIVFGAGEEADVRLEATVDREVIHRLVPQVPLADEVTGVVGARQLLGEDRGVERQDVGAEAATGTGIPHSPVFVAGIIPRARAQRTCFHQPCYQAARS